MSALPPTAACWTGDGCWWCWTTLPPSSRSAPCCWPGSALFREIGDRYCEATALNSLGETHHAVGQFADARIQHTAALTLATETDHRYEQARAHNGLAHTHQAVGDRE
jgi:Tetratricopeptide repeat